MRVDQRRERPVVGAQAGLQQPGEHQQRSVDVAGAGARVNERVKRDHRRRHAVAGHFVESLSMVREEAKGGGAEEGGGVLMSYMAVVVGP